MGGVVERLGHVLGWTGTGLAVLTLGGGLIAAGNSLWEGWNPKITTALEIEMSDGASYYAFGPTEDYGAYSDATNAVKKLRGEAVTGSVNDAWTVFALDGQSPTEVERMKALEETVATEKKAAAWKSAMRDAFGYIVITFACAAILYLIGLAFRYILSGPSKSR